MVYKRELFFRIKHPDDDRAELIDVTNTIIIVILCLAGVIRTVVMFVFMYVVLLPFSSCVCLLCILNFRDVMLRLFREKAINRFLSFNCNCLCYPARPKLRFQL